jgi:hypothetical protein
MANRHSLTYRPMRHIIKAAALVFPVVLSGGHAGAADPDEAHEGHSPLIEVYDNAHLFCRFWLMIYWYCGR